MKKASASGKRKAQKTAPIPSKPRLPRALASPKLKQKSKHVFLFQGGSAVDRMQTASLLADRLSLKLYRIDIRPFICRFIGETEKNLAKVFDHVSNHDTMLYFDEADCLFGKRSDSDNGQAPYVNGWVDYLNKRLKEFPGSVVVATNSNSKTSRISSRLKPVVAHIH
jgi:AAA+ superfamily predicted ATPase